MRSPREKVDHLRKGVSFALVGAIVVSMPANALAGPPSAEVDEAFDRGLSLYEQADYDAAIQAWEKALAQVPQEDTHARARLLLDLSTAWERKFDASGEVAALREAKRHLLRYDAAVDAAYVGSPESWSREQARIRDRLARIEGKLPTTETKATQGAEAPPPRLSAASADSGQALAEDEPVKSNHRALIAGGWTLTVLGLGGLGMMAVGIIEGIDPLLYSGAGVALVGGSVGIPMAVFGARRKRTALSSQTASVHIGPGPTLAGVGFGGAF